MKVHQANRDVGARDRATKDRVIQLEGMWSVYKSYKALTTFAHILLIATVVGRIKFKVGAECLSWSA